MAPQSITTTSTKTLVLLLCVMMFAQRKEGNRFCTAAGNSRIWPVGDSAGWSFSVMGWPNYKPFKTGDVLLFHYKRGTHNVVQVSIVEYTLCKVPGYVSIWRSGDDRITLARGVSFFISGIPGDCDKGMRIAVTAR
ncbi:hypothetical protein PR202_ga30092 [Eleusine coracana subsp. coracana]|uniref:Phytocyanin domain-containing protein n=1 Tax=Eleusine coracana subsp. coracana TaxID=191504 RepID=A0AAV5DPN5_ELECO|nr:hypothetical protein PR202_ga30092 [Eleusine coracana subsp. coracana]